MGPYHQTSLYVTARIVFSFQGFAPTQEVRLTVEIHEAKQF